MTRTEETLERAAALMEVHAEDYAVSAHRARERGEVARAGRMFASRCAFEHAASLLREMAEQHRQETEDA